jgi:anti-anti-sigma regulatory factor
MLRALVRAWRRKSRHTLKISIQQTGQATQIKIEGRIAGPWTAELGRVWTEAAPGLADRKVVLDLRDVTYADAGATQLLSEIYAQTRAELLVGTVWTQSLAEQITRGGAQTPEQEL